MQSASPFLRRRWAWSRQRVGVAKSREWAWLGAVRGRASVPPWGREGGSGAQAASVSAGLRRRGRTSVPGPAPLRQTG